MKSLKVFCQKRFFSLVFWFCVKSLFKCYLVKIFTSGVGFLNMQLSLYIVQMQFYSGILSLHITFQCVLLEMTFYRQTPEPLPSQSNKWCGLWKWASCWEFLLRSVCSLHLCTIVAVLNHAKTLWWFVKKFRTIGCEARKSVSEWSLQMWLLVFFHDFFNWCC